MGQLEFRVLGPVDVVLDGVVTRLGSPTQRTLLALLLMHANKVVSTDGIVDVLWRDDLPEARRKLWFHVSKLRGILQRGGSEDAAAGVLETRPTGYLLRVHSDQLDAARFKSLTRSARAILGDDPARAAETLRRALALWRGDPFEDVVHEDAVSSEVARLNELRLAAFEDRLEADLALGRGGELIPELEALVAEHPFREHFRAQLILALYRAGRQADALEAYREARRTLVEELGLEPSEELKELQRRVLAHDPALSGTRPPPYETPGAELSAGGHAASVAVETSAPQEERKLVTVFVAEIVDGIAKGERLDPEDVRAFISPYHARIRSEVERFGGSVEKFIGGTAVAIFGAPVAHEDDPERAVRAALAICDWLAEQDAGQRARIAVATGEALVTVGGPRLEGAMAVGEVVNTAAGMQTAAPVDGVIVGEQTLRATRHAIEYGEAKPFAAQRKGEPIRVWQAIRPLGAPRADFTRHRSPFVGRERELAALQERLASARSQRSPQLVTILGVPGIGKSRLVAELQRIAVAARAAVTWRQGRSLPYGDGVSFWALGEIVKAEAEILESDPAEDVERKLGRTVERTIDDPADAERIATSLQALIGLGGREVAGGAPRVETFMAWRHFLEALAEERPLVLVFEDLHWADEGLLDFVDELTDRVSGVELLVIATARLELLTRRPGWGGGKASALTISLLPLSDDETSRLVAALLEQPLPQAEMQEALLSRVGGNPFYAEQFCRMLLDGGGIGELPETVHGTIDARIDRLATEQKQLLRDAAVVGRVFWAGALEAIGGVSRQRADEVLHELERGEFIHRARRSSIASDTEYAFRHDLLRDVAYGGITRATRAERHRLTAEWIESLGHSDDHAELLAHHYLAALEVAQIAGEDVASLRERALVALQRAGLRAIRLSANDRAAEYLSRAIELVAQLPEEDARSRTEAELQLQLGIALLALLGHSAPEVEHAYARATELMMAIAPAATQLPIHFGLWVFHCQRGNFARSTPLAERMAELASEGDESMRLQALHARWGNSLFGGRIDDAIAAADDGQAIYRPDVHHALSFRYGNHDPGVCAMSHQAVALALRGQSATAVERMHRAVELSEAVGHAVSRAEPLSYLPWIFQINGDVDAAVVATERALALEGEVVHPVFFGVAHAMRGWALSRMGRHAEAIEELQRALADQRRVVNHVNAVIIGAILAEAYLCAERPDATRSLLDEMRPLAESMQTCTFEPELLRVEAEWLRLAGQERDARRLLIRTIRTARERGSLALALRAAVQLARKPSAQRDSDLDRLEDLCDRLPPENDTDYGREAKVILGRVVATAKPE